MNSQAENLITDLAPGNKKLAIRIAVITIINILLFSATPHEWSSMQDRFVRALTVLPTAPVIIGFILGTVAALIPYRKLKYSQKYLRASLWVMLSINLLILTMCILILILYFANDRVMR